MAYLLAPIITEKSMKDAQASKFTFKVEKSASKTDIKKEIEAKFKVNVVKVATITVKGRTQSFGARRIERKMPVYKKAIVALKSGQKIGLFELGETK